MQKIKLKTEESGKKLLEAYAPPKWSETADDDDDHWQKLIINILIDLEHFMPKKYLKVYNKL